MEQLHGPSDALPKATPSKRTPHQAAAFTVAAHKVSKLGAIVAMANTGSTQPGASTALQHAAGVRERVGVKGVGSVGGG